MSKTKWILDDTHSEIQFKVKHLMISSVTGQFNKFNGTVETTGEDFSNAKVQFEAEVNSISTNNEQRDAHLKAGDFFDAEKHPALSSEEREYIAAGQESHLRGDGTRPAILKILRQRNFWGIALPRFLADPTWGTLTFWLPLYLSTVRHFNLKEIALTAWLPFVAADLGCMFGGTVVVALEKRGVSLINARRGAFTLGAGMMICMAFVGFVQSPYTAVGLLCLGGFAHQTLSVTVITMTERV